MVLERDEHPHLYFDEVTPRLSRLNADYVAIDGGSKYEHIEIWSAHHGMRLNTRIFVHHHKNGDKSDNRVCDRESPCPILNCGNLAPMTRADHIREHRPGKMSGAKGYVDTKKRKQRAR